MRRQWRRERSPHWDEGKRAAFADAEPEAYGLGSPAPDGFLPDEWWQVLEDGRVVGYGRLDSQWGDAEILVAVLPAARGTGVGGFVLDNLAAEAAKRGLNYLYNTVRPEHPGGADVTSWLRHHGFTDAGGGELRKRVDTGAPFR